ncbi:hypothetical protein AOLI_G00000120 [Acnodon oligacanthus]
MSCRGKNPRARNLRQGETRERDQELKIRRVKKRSRRSERPGEDPRLCPLGLAYRTEEEDGGTHTWRKCACAQVRETPRAGQVHRYA